MTIESFDTSDLGLECLYREPGKVNPIVEDPGGPYLFVDLYPFDFDNPHTPQIEDPPWEKAIANPLVFGFILKATDGAKYAYTSWFVRNFKRLVELARDRRGASILLGGYHYAQFFQDGAAQADFYLAMLQAAGWGKQDIMPVIDVEFGNERAANRKASTQQIIDCVSKIAERLKAETGRRVMLYGRGAMRDRSIGSKMACDCVWNPAYTERMVTNGLVGVLPNGKPAPWTLDDLALWQFCGDGVGDNDVTHLPLELVGFGKVDLSVVINGANPVTLSIVRQRLL